MHGRRRHQEKLAIQVPTLDDARLVKGWVSRAQEADELQFPAPRHHSQEVQLVLRMHCYVHDETPQEVQSSARIELNLEPKKSLVSPPPPPATSPVHSSTFQMMDMCGRPEDRFGTGLKRFYPMGDSCLMDDDDDDEYNVMSDLAYLDSMEVAKVF